MDPEALSLSKIIKYVVLLVVLCAGTGLSLPFCVRREKLTREEEEIALSLKLDIKSLELLKVKPLYKFNEPDIDLYLRFLYALEPDQRNRIVHLARKSIGQKYRIFLLGEFPFELYDSDPLFTLKKSDCLVFSEHMYAMSLSWNWRSFFALLQRIRYKDGEISMVTRNHYTIPDWDRNNSWLLEDLTDKIAGEHAKPMTVKTARVKFFEKYGITWKGDEAIVETSYIPANVVPDVLSHLKDGDFVNVIRGFDEASFCGHTGLITVSKDGTVNFLHSTPPRVTEQPIIEHMEKALAANPEKRKQEKAIFYGFKFFRFREDALERLRETDGHDAPRVTAPRGILESMPE